MEPQLHRPLRVLLVALALALLLWALNQGQPALIASAGAGAQALAALALVPHKIHARWRFFVAAAMLLPWLVATPWSWTQTGLALLTGLALCYWASMGLRPSKGSARPLSTLARLASLLALLALWGALAVMGGALSSLLWNPEPAGATANIILGLVLVIFHHAGFYLRSQPAKA